MEVINRTIFLLSIFLLGCQNYDTPKELRDRFYLNKKYFDSLTTKLNRDKKFDSLFHLAPYTPLPDIKNSNPKELILLNELGITSLTSHTSPWKNYPQWYIFKTNWPSKHDIFLIYNDNYYDSTESFKDFYKKDKYENETWGLGDNWKMFRFVDTIDAKL